MDFKPLQYIYQPVGNVNAYTLLLLHGTGGNERDLLPLAGTLGQGFNVLSLRGNVQEHGMPRFFRRLGMGVFDEEDVHFRTHEMVHFLKKLSANEGFDISQLLAVGYSNGANIAGAMLMLYPNVYADTGAIDWLLPKPAFDSYLRALVDAGFGKRLMFGTDQMFWPDAIGLAVERIRSAAFLSREEQRDILYNNAVRFYRLG